MPDSPPLVTYPRDAAAPGYNWHDNRPCPSAEDDQVYVPVPGDEDYVDADFTICREPNAPPIQSLSAIMRAKSISFATPSVPSIYSSTNPARPGAVALYRTYVTLHRTLQSVFVHLLPLRHYSVA